MSYCITLHVIGWGYCGFVGEIIYEKRVVEWASCVFNPTTSHDYQVAWRARYASTIPHLSRVPIDEVGDQNKLAIIKSGTLTEGVEW